jgi:lysophospholipase L1-like esterase
MIAVQIGPPQVRVLLAVFPRGNPADSGREKITEINRIVARLDDQPHVFCLDIGAKFLDGGGYFLPGTFRPDNLHPASKGYDIWGAAVKDKVAELIK